MKLLGALEDNEVGTGTEILGGDGWSSYGFDTRDRAIISQLERDAAKMNKKQEDIKSFMQAMNELADQRNAFVRDRIPQLIDRAVQQYQKEEADAALLEQQTGTVVTRTNRARNLQG